MTEFFQALQDWGWGSSIVETAVEGEGSQRTFTHDWPWPPWLTLLVVIAITAAVVGIYSRELGFRNPGLRRARLFIPTFIRCVLIGLIMFMMYGWMQHQHRTELPEIVIAIDASESMAFPDKYKNARVRLAVASYVADDPTRIDLAKALLSSERSHWLEELKTRYRVKLFRIGNLAQRLNAESESNAIAFGEAQATDTASRLGLGLRDILDAQRGKSTAAVILLTDGINTQGPAISEMAKYAQRKSIKLYIVGLGSQQPPSDIRISDLMVEDIALVNDVLNFDFQLHSHGFSGRDAVVRLVRDDNGSALAEKTVAMPQDDEALPVRLSYRPQEEGDFAHTIEVEPFTEEADHDNNRKTKQVRIRDATVRVLLVQASPSYEYRFLKNLLSRAMRHSDSSKNAIELRIVLQNADMKFAAEDETVETVFPVQQDEIFDYDVLILGDANPAFFSRSVMQNITAFVQDQGGGVLFIAGPKHMPRDFQGTPIEHLMPFDLATADASDANAINDDFNVQPTSFGIKHPVLQIGDTEQDTRDVWNSLPKIRWMLAVPDVNTTAMVLAEHPAQRSLTGKSLPVLLMQFVGAGKVAFQTTDETYLWARYRGQDLYHSRYWMQLIRYLGRSKLVADRLPVEITTDSQHYLTTEPVQLRVLFRDKRLIPSTHDGVTATIEDSEGTQMTVVLRQDASNPGLFKATQSNLRVANYQLRLATPVVDKQPPARRFSIESHTSEQTTMQMNALDLAKAARISGGKFYTIASAARLPRELPSGEQVRIESQPPEPIWNSSWLAGLFVALIATEWILRKRAGLL